MSPLFWATSPPHRAPRENQIKFEKIRDELISDPEVRERLRVMEKEGGLVDQCIWVAFQKACK